MTYVNIGSSPFICYINNPNEDCDSNNLLLTLNQFDRGKETQILKQLVNFGINGTGSARSREKTVAYLGIQVENSLGTAGPSEPPKPNPTTAIIQPQ